MTEPIYRSRVLVAARLAALSALSQACRLEDPALADSCIAEATRTLEAVQTELAGFNPVPRVGTMWFSGDYVKVTAVDADKVSYTHVATPFELNGTPILVHGGIPRTLSLPIDAFVRVHAFIDPNETPVA